MHFYNRSLWTPLCIVFSWAIQCYKILTLVIGLQASKALSLDMQLLHISDATIHSWSSCCSKMMRNNQKRWIINTQINVVSLRDEDIWSFDWFYRRKWENFKGYDFPFNAKIAFTLDLELGIFMWSRYRR